MTESTCVLCPVYRPDSPPRPGTTVCPADAARLERDLLAVHRLWDRLVAGEADIVDDLWYPVTDAQGQVVLRRRDPVAAVGGAGNIAARSLNPAVSGSREAPLPINVDAIDLTAAARSAAPVGDPRDRIGHLSVASVLDLWVRHLRRQLRPDFHLPGDDVASLSAFLHRHLQDAMDRVPEVLPALAGDLRCLASAMRALLGEVEPVPQPLLGVRCEHCQTMSSLVPWVSNEYVECGFCGQLYTDTERVSLAKRQLAAVRRPRHVSLNGRLPGLAFG